VGLTPLGPEDRDGSEVALRLCNEIRCCS